MLCTAVAVSLLMPCEADCAATQRAPHPGGRLALPVPKVALCQLLHLLHKGRRAKTRQALQLADGPSCVS